MEQYRVPARPDLDCISGALTPMVVAAAARRARDVGVGIDRVLAVCGVMSEERYLRAFADRLGIRFETLEDTPRAACPLGDDLMVDAVAAGMLPLVSDGATTYVVVARAVTSPSMKARLRRAPGYPTSIRLTSEARLAAFVHRHAGEAVADRAAGALARRQPEMSAASTPRCAVATLAALSVLTILGVWAWPRHAHGVAGTCLAALFVAWSALRLWAAASAPDFYRPRDRIDDAELPHYTVVAALHDEARSVGGLVAALDGLDYPSEKLDIKLVLERDDAATLAAVAALRLHAPYEVIVAPDRPPRTKPKALNAALPFARGRFIAVYDAEDEPEPDQLRAAVACFRDHGPELVCVQARLTIANADDTWLTRLFAAEYAGLFDVFLPGLARHRLPLPLGGSSNHFVTAALRQVGAWDPHNVTEDADLGMRLARFGFEAAVMASSTFEEAPGRLGPWLRQRTRWFKGWTQTWLVHMRRPWRLWRDLGPAGFLVFQLAVGGSVLAALVHPLFLAVFAAALASEGSPPAALLFGLYGVACVAGYASSIVLGTVGLARRGLLSRAWVLLTIPVYWLLLSAAAWRALFKLVARPFEWEKTPHGLARTWRKQG
jgi:cellulose synthase/poly-beta-1,6-N-acetylglucosamine synthase-like glycosyltransferase